MIDVPKIVTIEAAGVSRMFGARHERFTAVNDVSLSITSRSATGIVGESGSGKSTLSRLLVGLDKPSTGTVTIDGRDISELAHTANGMRELRRTVQFVAQDSTSSFDPRRTLRYAVRRPAQILRGLSRPEADAAVDELLEVLSLDPASADRYPGEVSGGQRQRFSLARALIVRPSVLMCDEVVSALDVSVQGTILNFIKQYCAEHNCGLVFVSHGLPATAFISDEMVVMYRGQIIEHRPSDEIVSDPREPYTVSLIDAYRGKRTA